MIRLVLRGGGGRMKGLLAVLLIATLLLSGCAKEESYYYPPSVSTLNATNVGVTIATLNGNITDLGGCSVTERGFESSGLESIMWSPVLGYGACYGNGYLYVGTYDNPCTVYKINTTTMVVVANWTGTADIDQPITAMMYFNGEIYACEDTIPGRIVKLNSVDMTLTGTWNGAVGEDRCNGLTNDGINIYVSSFTDPAKVDKINPTNMTTIDVWTGTIGGEMFGGALQYDGVCIYCPCFMNPAKVVQIYASNMTTKQVWTGNASQNRAFSSAWDGTNLYVGCLNEDYNETVIKLNVSDMTTQAVWLGDHLGVVDWITYANGSLYAFMPIPFEDGCVKINPLTMTTVSKWNDSIFSASGAACASWDGTNLYVCSGGGRRVLKADPITMTVVRLNWIENGTFGTGQFNHSITNLTPNTTYWYRAKALNCVGWGYGNWTSFTTLSFPLVPLNFTITQVGTNAALLNMYGQEKPLKDTLESIIEEFGN